MEVYLRKFRFSRKHPIKFEKYQSIKTTYIKWIIVGKSVLSPFYEGGETYYD